MVGCGQVATRVTYLERLAIGIAACPVIAIPNPYLPEIGLVFFQIRSAIGYVD